MLQETRRTSRDTMSCPRMNFGLGDARRPGLTLRFLGSPERNRSQGKPQLIQSSSGRSRTAIFMGSLGAWESSLSRRASITSFMSRLQWVTPNKSFGLIVAQKRFTFATAPTV